jgi:hypothetical protein
MSNRLATSSIAAVFVGHKYSIAAYLPEKPEVNTPPWLIPLACTRIDTTQHAELVRME